MLNNFPVTLLPHAYCLQWQPGLLLTYAGSNLLIALAYFSIPLAILKFVRTRRDIEFRKLHWLFGAFIAACGATHLLHVITIWWPYYYLASAMDFMTAMISIMAAVVAWKILPVLLVMPSGAQLREMNARLTESEMQLKQSEERLLRLSNNLPDSYLLEFMMEGDRHRFLHLSSGFERLHGIAASDVITDSAPLLAQIEATQLASMVDAMQFSAQSMTDFEVELPILRNDGEQRWLHLRTHPSLNAHGEVVWDGIATDVTNRHLLESEINRLAQAVEQSPNAILLTAVTGELVYVNTSYARLTGYQFYDVQGWHEQQLIATELSDAEYAGILDALRTGRVWNGLLSSRHKDGKLCWEQVSASAVFDQTGRISHHLYTKLDVTERENLLRRLQLANQVFNCSNEAIMVCDADNTIVSVNPAFSRITGYAESDVVGKSPNLLSSGHHPRDFYATLWQSLRSHGEWSGEIWNRRKDGSVYPEWLSINTVKSPEGEIESYVSIFSDITSRKAAEDRINYLAHYDQLTNLPNRILLNDRVKVALATAHRYQTQVAIMFLDLDRFKIVNDSLGHHVGDQLLQGVAKRLSHLLREEDTVSRVGGDEFIVVITEADYGSVTHIAQKMLHSIAQPYMAGHHEINVGLSIGIAIYPENGKDFNDLSRAADSALYRAKQVGRNNYQFFTSELHEKATHLLEIENGLRRALQNEELFLHYQPQFDITGRHILGAEALVRWHSAKLGNISPAHFIPVAEENGMILEIGRFVLDTALKQQAVWLRAGHPVVPIAVNLSLAQFRQPRLCEEVAEALKKHQVPPELLELELTESMAMEDSAYVVKVIDKLNALGIHLSIDDFGTGYSSLSYLKRFHVHKLKIDRSFINDINEDDDAASIVSAIINMAHSLRYKVIAEGVETAEQQALLATQGCDEVQGFLFSKPLPTAEFLKILLQHR